MEQETLVRVLRTADARRAAKQAAARVIEMIYRRSPMFERFRLQRERLIKQDYKVKVRIIDMCMLHTLPYHEKLGPDANLCTAPISGHCGVRREEYRDFRGTGSDGCKAD